ncbi:MAG: hypothetical protein GTO08_04900, partial [Deltaproteobacteria bacterium]|nr:hypothetical protein [Deltaproteobacteria bacterium]
MAKKYIPLNFDTVKTCRLSKRKSRFSLDRLGKPFSGGDFRSFIRSLPDTLASRDLKAIAKAIVTARRKKRPVLLGMGAHPIKVGISPVIIDLMKREIITAVAMNGACIVHDFELALIGHTSEDVDTELCKGTFGMAEET